jgi:hypothetical protein
MLHQQHAQRTSGESSNNSSSGSSNHSGHDHSGACTCLGMCCFGAPVAQPSSAIALVDVEIVEQSAPTYAPAVSPTIARVYAQPFANGPPARA